MNIDLKYNSPSEKKSEFFESIVNYNPFPIPMIKTKPIIVHPIDILKNT